MHSSPTRSQVSLGLVTNITSHLQMLAATTQSVVCLERCVHPPVSLRVGLEGLHSTRRMVDMNVSKIMYPNDAAAFHVIAAMGVLSVCVAKPAAAQSQVFA
jgi:hypothetical protein